MSKIVYIHGFGSSGESEKAQLLRKAFPNDNVISPSFSANPLVAVSQLHKILSSGPVPTIVIGTSLGGFYATYLAVRYDVPAFIINPSLEPHITLQSYIGKHKRYGNSTDTDYDFQAPYIDELNKLFDKMHASDKAGSNLHFYLSTDDDVLTYEKLDTLFPNRQHVKTFNNSGHRFSKFSEIFPDIQKALDKFPKKK